MSTEWTDEEFLDYFEIHCRTERALFNGHQIRRLVRLGGAEGDDVEDMRDDEWATVREDVAQPRIDRARARLAADTEEARA